MFSGGTKVKIMMKARAGRNRTSIPWVRLGAFLALLLSIVAPGRVNAAPHTAHTSGCPGGSCPGIFYGASPTLMNGSIWDLQEQYGNWCGIANIAVISNYDWLQYNNGVPPYLSQSDIHDLLNSSGDVSPWGRAVSGSGRQYGPGPYVAADISADGGTDPFAIVEGVWHDTPPGYYFHNWIYRTSASTATYDFGSDFGAANGVNDPISVTINGGAHSFVIDGVWASSDPSSSASHTIYYIDTWDPWLDSNNQPFDHKNWYYNTTQNEAWSLSDWTSLSKFWGQGYNPYNTYDPEPNTTGGNYYNSPPLSAHWGGYFVTIEQDYITGTSYVYAFDQNGNLAPHN